MDMRNLNENPEYAAVGEMLAARVADRLDDGAVLIYVHRDYCGMGLAKDEDTYVYASVWDGYPPTIADIRTPPVGQKFASRDKFIEWLASQTDESLSGRELDQAFFHGNQRITVQRLREFTDAA